MDPDGSKVLVTGGTGTIGPQVLGELLRQGWSVTAVSRSAPNVTHPRLVWKKFDLLSDVPLEGLTRDHDVVLHMANLSKVDLAQDRRVAFALANDAKAMGVPYFFYTSSIRVFGNSAGRVSDDAPPRPCREDTYAQNKVEVEKILGEVLRGSQTRYTLLRVGDVITDQKFSAIPKELSFKGLIMWGRARPHFIHVNDVAAAIGFLLGARERLKHERFNLTRELSGPSTYADFYSGRVAPWKRALGKVLSVPPMVPRFLYRNRSEGFGTRSALIAEGNLIDQGFRFGAEELSGRFSTR